MADKFFFKTRVQIVGWTSAAVIVAAVTWQALTLSSGTQCRCFPGDDCWPSPANWAALNQSVHGALVATVPIGSPCHDTFPGVAYDAEKCAEIQANWPRPELHEKTAHSVMASIFANMSCDPFTARDAPCKIGTYVPYAVNASGAADYKKTIAFAKEHNIRLVVRNTGHDYMGKSTGAGALALWTHYIKGTHIFDYSSPAYRGKAMKIGAGVVAGEAQRTATAEGYVVVEGDCETVGIAGGYAQGGGTSPLASKFGLASDQVLEWEVVTADGTLRAATPTQNQDLYWALSGGGGGTYGAVLSMTVKLHKNMPTSAVTMSFTEVTDTFWEILRIFIMNLPAAVDAGATLYWMVVPGNTFLMPQTYFPNGTAAEFAQLLQPTLQALEDNMIQYAFNQMDFLTFEDAYNTLNPTMNISAINFGGRIIPRSLVATDDSASDLVSAIHSMTDNLATFAGVSMNVSKPPTSPNAVHPAWRDSIFFALYGLHYDQANYTANVVAQSVVNDVLSPPLDKLVPERAAYLNEANFDQADWKHSFYGKNYAKLLAIKRKYDPHNVFWGSTAVGGEALQVMADGRLCKA
ncbi:FAD binding domain protein [Xylaria bambusicola]|uniref:FAD binding domain protein n=1 Tax=Xylaria bambusicola TaxID=326684 RepID=UPI0020083037|nr:FAD binding domain protein [Xylaria bambusicola]KAI0514660.1 FAD binding domain protein [Xylaria bambusicola]